MNNLENWERGTDRSYNALLESREREILEDEFIRDWILEDEVAFHRYAQMYLDDPVNREGFLDYAVEQAKRERTPQWNRGWEK